MNMALLDRAQLEAIVLDPPATASTQLICSDNAVADYITSPTTKGDSRLRHVLAAAHELLTRIAAQSLQGKSILTSPQAVKDFLRVYFAGAERESFVVIYVDTQHRVIDVEELFAGTVSQTSVYPREVVRRAMHFNASAVLFAHCHPSSDVRPSSADEYLTSTLKQALSLVDVRVLDHLVVAPNGSAIASFAERGLL